MEQNDSDSGVKREGKLSCYIAAIPLPVRGKSIFRLRKNEMQRSILQKKELLQMSAGVYRRGRGRGRRFACY